MLFLLTGSSGAGKSSALHALRVDDLLLLDVDELVPPPDVERAWWHQQVEALVVRAADAQALGLDSLIAGWTPLGEVLAAPSATRLEAIAACLLDCDDETRAARIAQRAESGTWGPGIPGPEESMRAAEWMRRHADDPQWHQDVLLNEAWPEMRWERWTSWTAGDRRWAVERLDTSHLSVEEAADRIAAWIGECRRRLTEASLPLAGAWWQAGS